MPEKLQDELGGAGIDKAINSTARKGIVMKPHEFMRIALISSGLKGMADKLKGLSPCPVDKVELPTSPDPCGGSGELERKLSPLSELRSASPGILRKRIIRITIIPKKMSDSSEEDLPEPIKRTIVKSPLLDKVSAAYNGYRLWLIANAPELGLGEDSVDFNQVLSTGHMSKSAAVDKELTVAYLQHAHWQAGELLA
jgi:hypothetical protein